MAQTAIREYNSHKFHVGLMNIIEISQKELKRIQPLWHQLTDTHRRNTTYWWDYFEKFSFTDRIQGFINSNRFTAFIAVENNLDIGYSVVSIKDNAGEIDSIFVLEDFRKRGIGKKLLERSLTWLEEYDIQDIKVGVVEGNESVFPFYEEFGFKPYMTMLKKSDPGR